MEKLQIALRQTFSFDILKGSEIFEDLNLKGGSKYICNENSDNIVVTSEIAFGENVKICKEVVDMSVAGHFP